MGLLLEQPDAGAGGELRLPRKSVSTPAMMRSSVDLPEPLSPSTPILAPGMKDSETSLSTALSGGWIRDRRYMVKMYWLDMNGRG